MRNNLQTQPDEARAKYDAAAIKKMVANGEAMPDGSYPIADGADLHDAIHAVGRGGASHDAIRKHIISRAKALGMSDQIPDDWNSDGSLKGDQMNSRPLTDPSVRSVPFSLVRAEEDGDGLTFSGYAAVFNSPTRIRGEGPEFDEQIAPGAFKKTIRESPPVFMYDHGQHPLIGSMPIGKITSLREDARGLYVEARMHDNWLTQPIRDAIRSGSVDGMSFRFTVPGKDKQTWDYSGQIPFRTVHEAKVPELGPVVFPAYKDTTAALRSLIDILGRDGFTEALRDCADSIDAEPLEPRATDIDDAVQDSRVEQIQQLVALLMQDEAGELADNPEATGSLNALLCVLSDLSWFQTIDAIEDDGEGDSDAVAYMNSTPYQAAVNGTWRWEPQRDPEPQASTPQTTTTPSEADATLTLLRLRKAG